MNGNWFVQSLAAMGILIPVWLAIGFFERHYQIKSEVFLLWYFVGVIITTALFSGHSADVFISSWKASIIILLIGATAGGLANVLLFRAVAAAPNPGLPLAITSTTSIAVFLASIVLAKWAPSLFPPVKSDPWTFLGVALAIAGVSIVAIRR